MNKSSSKFAVLEQHTVVRDFNKKTWMKKAMSKEYFCESQLFPAEVALFKDISPFLTRKSRILDIGVGTGRTSSYLSGLTPFYTGIDYSSCMVDLARQRFPDLDLMVRDARDLSCFPSDYFDLVFFSYNGIDYVSHEYRLILLRQVRSVMKKDGIFVFSSHNRSWPGFGRFKIPIPSYDGNAVRYAYKVIQALYGTIRHALLQQYGIQTETYAIINDPAHCYRLLTYYISPSSQICQLTEAGFSDDVSMYDSSGKSSEASIDTWIYYCCTKKA